MRLAALAARALRRMGAVAPRAYGEIARAEESTLTTPLAKLFSPFPKHSELDVQTLLSTS